MSLNEEKSFGIYITVLGLVTALVVTNMITSCVYKQSVLIEKAIEAGADPIAAACAISGCDNHSIGLVGRSKGDQ